MSLVRFHRLVTTALALALGAVSGWRAEAFLAGGSLPDLLLSVASGLSAAGLVVYLAMLNRVFRREPGPGFPRDCS